VCDHALRPIRHTYGLQLMSCLQRPRYVAVAIVSQKGATTVLPQLHQVQNQTTQQICTIPPHLKRVATLPCETTGTFPINTGQ